MYVRIIAEVTKSISFKIAFDAYLS